MDHYTEGMAVSVHITVVGEDVGGVGNTGPLSPVGFVQMGHIARPGISGGVHFPVGGDGTDGPAQRIVAGFGTNLPAHPYALERA